MPEGHALHRLARGLTRTFRGEVVRASSPQGRFATEAAILDGRTCTGAEAWGKHLFVSFDGAVAVHVHLGLYGTWITSAAPVPEPVGLLRLRLETDRWYADLRGPTVCELVDRSRIPAITERLGPDPLRRGAKPDRAWSRVSASRAPIGALLMDQAVLAGVGNVYRAELLFRHAVSPFAEGRAVDRPVFDAMWTDLSALMRDGVRRGRIVTLDPVDVAAMQALDADRPAPDDPELDGGEDTIARRRLRRSTGVYVYRRDGRACLRCGATVAAQEFHGRTLFWCPGCQTVGLPRRRRRA